jgi:hypothetical protein
MTHIRIVDLPCGWGKSSQILSCFKKGEKYLTVVPSLSEVQRYIDGAYEESGFRLTQPVDADGRKSDHAEKLIREGKSLVCTHALYFRLGTIATQQHQIPVSVERDDSPMGFKVRTKHMLDDYNLLIDEVINPFEHEQSVKPIEFDEDYVALGMAEVHEDGRVEPTPKWDTRYDQGSRTFDRGLYEKAKSGALYKLSEGLFILTVPMELLTRPKTVTIYTYLSEGSVLLHFLRKMQDEHPGLFTLEVEPLDANAEREWRQDVASALTIKSIPGLEKTAWNHSAQLKELKTRDVCASIGHELRKFKEQEFGSLDLNSVMLTSARPVWCAHRTGERPKAGPIAKDSRLFGHAKSREVFSPETRTVATEWSTTGVQFVPNQTRGTNDHISCTHAVYLYDQNPNPQLLSFLGMKRDSLEASRFSDAYALTELVQWLFRSAIRVGGINGTLNSGRPRERATVYVPSGRMRNLLTNWLETGKVSALSKDGSPPNRVVRPRKRPARARKRAERRKDAA